MFYIKLTFLGGSFLNRESLLISYVSKSSQEEVIPPWTLRWHAVAVQTQNHLTMLAPFCILPDPHISVIFAE
jgi:hypothetical protein